MDESPQDLVVEGDNIVSGAALVSKNETSGEVGRHAFLSILSSKYIDLY